MNADRQLRFYKAYAAFASAAIAILLLTGFQVQFPKHQKFEELDVQRINVLEPDGKLDMVISNKAKVPDPIMNGKTAKRSDTSPGMIFYNSRGDEDGGLVFSGDVNGGKYEASAGLLFDQYKQDQIVGMVYEDENGKRRAGLIVWDRPNVPLNVLMDKMESMKSMKDADQQKAIAEMRERGEIGATRLFVGKDESKSSVLTMSDAKGKPRLKLSVAADGTPAITFLNEQGKAVYTLPENGAAK